MPPTPAEAPAPDHSFAGIAGTPNVAPVFTSSATHTVDENQWTGGMVNATDADTQDSVSYSIVGGADAALFSEGVAWDGLLEFKRSQAPDYEAPHDANGASLSVSWDAPARATHYDVTYNGNGANARAAWNRAGAALTITCDSRYPGQNQNCVDRGATYTVGILARNADGESAWRNSAIPFGILCSGRAWCIQPSDCRVTERSACRVTERSAASGPFSDYGNRLMIGMDASRYC